MQIFSWVLLGLVGYIIISSKSFKSRFLKALVLNIIIATHFESGYFLDFQGFEIDYDQVMSCLTLVLGVLAAGTSFDKKILKRFLLFYTSVIVGAIGIVIFPYGEKIVTGASDNYESVIAGMTKLNFIAFDISVVSGLIYFMIFSIILICAYTVFTMEDVKQIICRVSKGMKCILLYGLVELFFVYGFQNDVCRTVINFIFGRGQSTFSSIIVRNNGFMLQGLTREGSHYAFSLFVSIIIIYTACRIEKKKVLVWGLIYLVISFLSFSLSSVLYIVGLVALYFLIEIRNDPKGAINKLIKIAVISVGVLTVMGISIFVILKIYKTTDNYIVQRLGELIVSFQMLVNNTGGMAIFNDVRYNSSNMVRLYSVINTLKLLVHRPLFGFGIGVITCHGSSIMLLGDIGIVGFYAWYKFVTYVKERSLFSKSGFALFRAFIVIYILVNVLSSRYLTPFNTVIVLSMVYCAQWLFIEENEPKKIKRGMEIK